MEKDAIEGMIWVEEITSSLVQQKLSFISGNGVPTEVPFRYAYSEEVDIEGKPSVVFFVYDYAHAVQYETSREREKVLDTSTNPPTVRLIDPPVPFTIFYQFEVISWDPADDARMVQAFFRLLPPRHFWPVVDPETGKTERIFAHMEDFRYLDELDFHAKVGRRHRKVMRYGFDTTLDPKKVETAKVIADRIIKVVQI